ncbi:low-density lipoprotein receptor-related protein 5-like isoform X2 [Mytilus edulis]|uniref:low-density lipoprotein receptor-related protein 5-like isoform X2 n=1 Tax=Mytilus edulis TaxID=6550 RepID=UPI0039F0D53F
MGVSFLFISCLAYCFTSISFQQKVLFTTKFTIMELDFKTSNSTLLVRQNAEMFSMDYDYKNKFIYFPRYHHNDIMRFTYPSTNITLETVLKTGTNPSGLAIDSKFDHIYWTEIGTSSIVRCNLNGTYRYTFPETIRNPFVIRLDLANRLIYYVERRDGIIKSSFNLSEKLKIVTLNERVDCMDLDIDEERLYWITYDKGELKSASSRGNDVQQVISTNSNINNYALRVHRSYILYGSDTKLMKLNKKPGSIPTELYNDKNAINSIYVD